eukprot:1150037-Pelagomonas_calceolata.AAC.1
MNLQGSIASAVHCQALILQASTAPALHCPDNEFARAHIFCSSLPANDFARIRSFCSSFVIVFKNPARMVTGKKRPPVKTIDC